MSMMDTATKEALLESLYDLKHDLGKYIKMPVAMLPKDASWDEVTAQVRKAVHKTRKGQSGEISAATLFQRFVDEWEQHLASNKAYQQVALSVEAAIELNDRVEQCEPGLTRAEIEQVLGAVSIAISSLMDEVNHG
jgi:hypothetical protein